MALIAGRTELGIKRVGSSVIIPDDPRAKLMFYVKCICNVLDLSTEDLLDRLTDFRNFRSLSDAELTVLLILCVKLKPDELIGQCLFQDDDMCGDSQNAFYELSAVKTNFALTDSILIGGQQTHVKKVMFFKLSFLTENYYDPMLTFLSRLESLGSGGGRSVVSPQRALPYHGTQTSSYYYDDDKDGYCSCCTIL